MAGDVTIYFIQSGKDGPVKIGRTRNVQRRMNELQVASFYELHLLHYFKADPFIEDAFHEALAEHRIRGEWFDAAPALEILQEIIPLSFDDIRLLIAQRLAAIEEAFHQKRLADYAEANPPINILGRKSRAKS